MGHDTGTAHSPHTVEVRSGEVAVAVADNGNWTSSTELAQHFEYGVAQGWEHIGETDGGSDHEPFLRIEAVGNLSVYLDGERVENSAAFEAFGWWVRNTVMEAAQRVNSDAFIDSVAQLEWLREQVTDLFTTWDDYREAGDPITQTAALLDFANKLFHYHNSITERDPEGINGVLAASPGTLEMDAAAFTELAKLAATSVPHPVAALLEHAVVHIAQLEQRLAEHETTPG